MPTAAILGKKVAESSKPAVSQQLPADAEIRNAIRRLFFFDGEMLVRRLYTIDGIGRYRVNWYRDSSNGPYIHESRFLLISLNDGTAVVENVTAGRRQPEQ